MYMYLVLFLDEIGGNLRLSDYYSAAPLRQGLGLHFGILEFLFIVGGVAKFVRQGTTAGRSLIPFKRF